MVKMDKDIKDIGNEAADGSQKPEVFEVMTHFFAVDLKRIHTSRNNWHYHDNGKQVCFLKERCWTQPINQAGKKSVE